MVSQDLSILTIFMNDLIAMFIREKPLKLILFLLESDNKTYISTVSKRIDCTYSHVTKLLNILEAHSLIEFEKTGRSKIIELTSLGKEIASVSLASLASSSLRLGSKRSLSPNL